MAKQRRHPFKPRRRFRLRKARGQPRGARLREKVYKYVFKLPSQVAVGNTTAPGGFAIVGTQATPLIPGAGGSIGFVVPSTNGLSNFFDIGGACTFRFSDLFHSGVYQQMYDCYKLDSVTCDIEYLNNTSAITTSGLLPTIYIYWDQDDASPPPTIASINAKQGVKKMCFGNKNQVSFKTSGRPNTLTVVQSGIGAPAASMINQKNVWLDCLDPSVPHYSFKFWITDMYLPGTSAVNQAVRFNWTYHMSFKAPLATS